MQFVSDYFFGIKTLPLTLAAVTVVTAFGKNPVPIDVKISKFLIAGSFLEQCILPKKIAVIPILAIV